MATATRTVTSAGTTLATGGAVPESPDATDAAAVARGDIWRGRRNLYFSEETRSISRWAILVGAFIHAAVVGILAHADYPFWRVITIAGMFCMFAALQRMFIHKAQDQRCV